MKFFVYANRMLIGWTELPSGDPPMGVASGLFHPTLDYALIGPLVRRRQKYDGSYGVRDDVKLAEINQELAKIQFTIEAEDGTELHPVAGIHLSDFGEELDQDAFEISVLGLPNEEYMRYFKAQYDRYTKQFTTDDP